MILRLAAVLIILSQLILLGVLVDTNGSTAITFSFLGHPILGLGLLLALASIVRRSRHGASDA